MAHKKGVGSSKNGRESQSKRLGVKLFGGESVKAGNIILRQRGTQHHPGENAGIGRDHTIYALTDGMVVFRRGKNDRSYISVKNGAAEPVIVQQESVEEVVAETADTVTVIAEAVVIVAEEAEAVNVVAEEAEVADTVAKEEETADVTA
jgi:large subunit ribosomal protein L27